MDDGILAASGLDLTFGFVREGINKLDLELDKLAYNEFDKKSGIEFEKVKIDANYEHIPEWDYLATGKQFISGGAIKINGTDEQGKLNNFGVKNWKVDFDTVRKDKILDSGAKIVFNGISVRDADLGDLTVDMALNHIDGEILNQLIQVYNDSAKQPHDELSDEEVRITKKFIDSQPQFIFNPTLNNKAGKLASNLDISMASADFENAISQGKIFSLFNHFIFKVDANKEALIEEAAVILQLDQLDKEHATKVATEQVNLGVKNSVQQGILVEDGKSVKLDLVLEKGELKLNGKEIPEEQVASMLFLLVMSMGQ